MSFTIPNEADAGNAKQSEIDSVDIAILVDALGGNGVISGCAVTAQGSPDMTVAVAAGDVRASNTRVSVTSGNVTITTADGSNPRFDLVVVDSSGTKSVTAGTPAASPVFPAIPADSIVLAAVHVPASDTAIESGQIIDKRATIRPSPLHGLLAGYYYTSPGWTGYTTGSLSSNAANSNRKLVAIPFVVHHKQTFDRISIRVTTAGDASSVVRLGIYVAKLDGTPGDLVLDAGTVALDSTGVKEITISQSLEPGAYWLAAVCDGLSATNPVFSKPSTYGAESAVNPMVIDSNNTPYRTFETSSGAVSGALPSPFPSASWGGQSLSYQGLFIFLRAA